MGCITKTIKNLNQISSEKGTSSTSSPSNLITGRARPDYTQVTKLNFGDYVQAYLNKGKTIKNMDNTVDIIALHPSGNE